MIAVIADDLTGAAEMAGLGWRYGLSAEILTRRQSPSGPPLAVYNLDSRNCSAAEAARRMKRLVVRLRRRKPEWVFKKVDSVLRGNVLAEIEAWREASGRDRCLLVPANPDNGRVIRGGAYFVHDVPIHQTDFRKDPVHPRVSHWVVDLLGASQPNPKSEARNPKGRRAVSICRPGVARLPNGIVVGEAASAGDVRHWAARVEKDTVAAGGADFFRALLRQRGHQIRHAAPTSGKSSAGFSRTLFVSGSIAESAARYVEASRAGGWPVLMMPRAMRVGKKDARAARARWTNQIIAALRAHPRVIMGIGAPAIPGPRAPLRLSGILVKAVAAVLSETKVSRVCVEGGATAAKLIEELKLSRLTVEREFGTGVIALRSRTGRGPTLVVKPGSYTWPAKLTA